MVIHKKDIVSGLKKLGLKAGDVVLLHSSLSSLGHVDGGAETVIEAFLAVLGAKGTLVVPTFGKVGVVTEVLREDPRAVKSFHPVACVAAIGAKAEEICREFAPLMQLIQLREFRFDASPMREKPHRPLAWSALFRRPTRVALPEV